MHYHSEGIAPTGTAANMSPAGFCQFTDERYRPASDDVEEGFDFIGGPTDSAATPPTCPKTCGDCIQQYRPKDWQRRWEWLRYDDVYSDKVAASSIEQTLTETQSRLAKVDARLKKHGNAILKRWHKKNRTKRAAMLDDVSGELCDNWWAPSETLYMQRTRDFWGWKDYDATWMLPWLNTEVLCEDANHLLALLHFRTIYSCEDWFQYDTGELRMPFNEGVLWTKFNPHAVIACGPSFGKLVQWNKEAAHKWQIVGYPRAEMTLKAQLRLALLLDAVTEALLAAEAPEGNDKWLALVAAGFHQKPNSADNYCLRAFGPPPQANDYESAEEVLRARMHHLQDTVTSLQREPKRVRLMLEAAKSSDRFARSTWAGQDSRLVRLMIGPSNRLDYITIAVSAAKMACLEHTKQKRSGNLAQSVTLKTAVKTVKHVLEELMLILTGDLLDAAALTPSFSKHWCRCPVQPCHFVQGTQDLYEQDRLFWCFYQLAYNAGAFRTDFLLGRIACLLRDRAQRQRLDDQMSSLLDDIAAVDQALRCLDYVEPRIETHGSQNRDELFESLGLASALSSWASNVALVREPPDYVVEDLKDFSKPTGLAWPTIAGTDVEGRLSATERLQNFWHSACLFKVVRMEREGVRDADVANIMQPLLAGINALANLVLPQWRSEPAPTLESSVNAPGQDIGAATERLKRLAFVTAAPRNPGTSSAAPAQTFWGHEHQITADIIKPKIKVKTRPEQPAAPDLPELVDLAGNEPDIAAPEREIWVNASSLEVFTRIFTPEETARATAEMHWDDFVSAMTDAGCRVEGRSGGSRARFIHGDRAVNLHRQHPSPYCHPIKLQEIRGKLQSWLGWEKKMFVLRPRA